MGEVLQTELDKAQELASREKAAREEAEKVAGREKSAHRSRAPRSGRS